MKFIHTVFAIIFCLALASCQKCMECSEESLTWKYPNGTNGLDKPQEVRKWIYQNREMCGDDLQWVLDHRVTRSGGREYGYAIYYDYTIRSCR